MSRWLEAAKRALPPDDKIDINDKNRPERIKSTPSILSEPASFTAPALAEIEPKPDAEHYADMLRAEGDGSYGSIGVLLGWGMTRAANAETALRAAGRLQYDNAGRGRLVDGSI